MTTKWRILRKPLQVRLKNVGKVFLCITRLHNFCINEGCDIPNTDEANGDGPTFIPSDVTVTNIAGNSILRDIIVDELARRALGRPQYNRERNRIN